MMHLWRLQLPADLAAGEHTATVTAAVRPAWTTAALGLSGNAAVTRG
jgi:hypothetical protein